MSHNTKDPLRFFATAHLPPHLRGVVGLFIPVAKLCADLQGASPQADVALQKLIEAKDAAVRAFIDAFEAGDELPIIDEGGGDNAK